MAWSRGQPRLTVGRAARAHGSPSVAHGWPLRRRHLRLAIVLLLFPLRYHPVSKSAKQVSCLARSVPRPETLGRVPGALLPALRLFPPRLFCIHSLLGSLSRRPGSTPLSTCTWMAPPRRAGRPRCMWAAIRPSPSPRSRCAPRRPGHRARRQDPPRSCRSPPGASSAGASVGASAVVAVGRRPRQALGDGRRRGRRPHRTSVGGPRRGRRSRDAKWSWDCGRCSC